MPVWMNEPLSIVQKTIEALAYWKQIDKGAKE